MLKQIALVLMILFSSAACSSFKAEKKTEDMPSYTLDRITSTDLSELRFTFERGSAHNYPTFAVWIETAEGEMIQTLFVTKAIATGYYRYGDAGDGKWLKVPGSAKRPAALPYWLHKREVVYDNQEHMPTVGQPFPDAYTGATPASDFFLNVQPENELPEVFKILVEINQPWDWNAFWSNDKYPENVNYKTSAQPSLVYSVTINKKNQNDRYFLNPIGHGHPYGDDGQLYTDLRGFTTALEIFSSIQLQYVPSPK